MALPLSPATRDSIKNLLICFSLANLCFLRRWYDLEHLKERAMDYYRAGPPDGTLMEATLICVLLLTAVFWVGWMWVERKPSPARVKLAQAVFLLACAYPLESVRLYWNQDADHFDVISNVALIALETVLGMGVVLAIMGNPRIVRAARKAALALTLLFPALMIDFGVNHLSAEPAASFAPKPPLPLLPPRAGPPRRVVWIVFDELDQRLVFDLRRPEAAIPELDRLRSESLAATHAIQTAPHTTIALPSLLSGVIYSEVKVESVDGLRVYTPDSRKGMEWRDAPNIFKKAREMGVNAALVGWHHPYCRVFGDALVRCLDVPSEFTTAALSEADATALGLWGTVGSLFERQIQAIDEIVQDNATPTQRSRDVRTQQRQQLQYFQIRDRAYADIADKQLDFVFVHVPVPHPFPLYNRRRGDFTLTPGLDYADNVALVDRTVGEIRKILVQSGLWDSTSLVITSDHGLRPNLWAGRLGWTPELDRLTGGKQSELVPVIVKLAGQERGATYDRQFSNVVCGDLSLAIVSGQLHSVEDVTAWLNQRADKSP